MGVNISIEMNPSIRRNVAMVSRFCSEDIINLIFAPDSLTLLGYTNTLFCLCQERIENEITYTFRVDTGIIMSLSHCDRVEFNIMSKEVNMTGYNKDEKVIMEVQVRLNMDTTVNYQADYYKELISKLRAGYQCHTLESLKQFDKISRINNKAERGVIISNGKFYTWGDGFKFYAKTDMKFNCFLLSDNLRELIDFVGNNDNIIYEHGGFIVAKNTSNCYLGIRVENPKVSTNELELVLSRDPESKFKISISDLKSAVRSIKSSKTHDGILTLSPRNGIAVVGLPTAVFRLPVDYEAENIAKMDDVKLNFKKFNKILQALNVSLKSEIRVYNRFISITSSDGSFMLVSRE